MVTEETLRTRFDRIWEEIRGANLYAGQPRSDGSVRGVLLARQALQIVQNCGNDQFTLEAWRMLAYSLTANEQYEEAIPYYKKAVEMLERMGELRQAARNRIGYVAALAHVGRHQEALGVAGPAEQWLVENNDEQGLARLYTNLGIVHHRLDEHTQGVECYIKAAEIFERLGDKGALAQTWNNLANVLSLLDQFEQSDNLYQRAEELSCELGLAELLAQASYNRAYLRYLRGRYSEALHFFSRLRSKFQRTGSQRFCALCDLDEAEIYLEMNLSYDASILAERAAEQFKNIGMRYEQAKATGFYGVALMQTHRFGEALDAFGEAEQIFEDEGNKYWIGLLDLYRAEVHLSMNRPLEAGRLARKAKQTFEQLAIPSKRIFSLVLLGRVAMILNDLETATVSAAEISGLIQTTRMPLVLFPYHVLCAEIAERLRKWDEARQHYESAAAELERHQARLHHDDLRVSFFKGRQQAYDALVRLSLDRMDSPEGLSAAYAWCERARSRALVELLAHCSPLVHAEAHPDVLFRIERLREELNIQYVRLQPESCPPASQSKYDGIAQKERELARSLRELSGVDPAYASLRQVSIAEIDSAQANLPEDATLIEYFTAGDQVLAFIISRTDAQVVRQLCTKRTVLELQARLRFQLDYFLLSREYVNDHWDQILISAKLHLRELYEQLLAPFIREVRTPHIIVVPHGPLHFLPFHAFYDGEKYLIDEYEFSYAPSASVLKYCLERGEIGGSSSLLVGVQDQNAPLIEEEIFELKRLFPDARVLQNAQATRAAFIENSKASSFLHIATHATFRHDNPMFSSFKLADGRFTALDLFSMACETNLVTLSGCQSGMGEVTSGDELLGFMRGFLYAGARSLLLALWNVNDESTTALMTHFYREWQKGASKSSALRSAMLLVRDLYAHPFYWAPFLLVGNP
jgi:CHAT domain-containing protein